jgi:hypothetical protein
MEKWKNVPKIFPLRGIRFSRILEKLQKSKIFYFSGEEWEESYNGMMPA